MKKGKILALVVSVFLAMGLFGVFAGCGEQDDPNTLKVAGLNGAYGKEYWEELKKGFEATHEGKKVELTIEANIEETIRPQLMAKGGPDVVYLATQRKDKLTEQMIDSKALVDLSGLLEKKVYGEDVKLKDRLLPATMGNGITNPYANDSKHYMLPLFFAGNGLFYNADKFYAHATPYVAAPVSGKYMMPTTWDEFFALGAQLKKEAEGKEFGSEDYPALFTYPTPGYLDTLIPATIASSAGEAAVQKCFNYDVDTWGSANVEKVFTTLGGLKDYILPTTMANGNNNDFKKNQQAVIDGTALFMTNGDWVKGEMAETTPAGFNWGSSPFLAFDNAGERFGTVNVEQIWINGNTKKQELAEEFLLYVYSKEGLGIIAKHANDAFVPAAGYDTIALAQGMNAGAVAGYKGYYDGSAKVLAGSFASATVAGLDWKSVYCGQMQDVMNGDKTAAVWYANIKDAVAKLAAAL